MRVQSIMDVTTASVSFIQQSTPAVRRMPFYLQAIGSFEARRQYLTDREGMDSYLLLYTLAGCGIVEQRQTRINLPVNQAVLLSCREPHFYATRQTEGTDPFWNFLYFHLDGCGIEFYFEQINGRGLQGIKLTDSARQQFLDQMTSLFDLAGQASSLPLPQDLQISVLLQQILTGLTICSTDCRQLQNPQQQDDIIAAAIQFLMDHFQEPLSLDKLARQFNLSKYHFARLFRLGIGQSPYAWLIGRRIDHSKNLLRHSHLSLQEIAVQSGFNDVNHFIRTFRQSTGTTPHRYRRENWLF